MRNQYDDRPDGPDIADVVAQVSQGFRRNFKKLFPLFLAAFALLALFRAVYQVGPGELGIVRTFGRESGTVGPGLHLTIPFAQSAVVVNVQEIRRIEVGYRGNGEQNEATMITGDENIVEAQMIIQYRVSDPSRFLFRLEDPERTLKATAEVALRSMVGRTTIDEVITTGREKLQADTELWLQKLMDDYQSGLTVTEVKLQSVDAPDEVREAFHDVVRAREEREKLVNQAEGYRADLIPRAKGERQVIEQKAQGYREERILRARGDADKFKAVLTEYAGAKRVTRERLYLETIERIFTGVDRKVFVDKELAKGSIPILPLGQGVASGALSGLTRGAPQ